jgi:hypothetical protein
VNAGILPEQKKGVDFMSKILLGIAAALVLITLAVQAYRVNNPVDDGVVLVRKESRDETRRASDVKALATGSPAGAAPVPTAPAIASAPVPRRQRTARVAAPRENYPPRESMEEVVQQLRKIANGESTDANQPIR